MTEQDLAQLSPYDFSDTRPLFIVSGGMGMIGEVVVRSSLAQFEGAKVPVTVIPRIRHVSQLDEVIQRVSAANGIIVHTMMDAEVRQALTHMAQAQHIPALDLVGHLLDWLANVLKRPPVGKPGLYRHLHEAYFRRIEAIEYTVAHDDGRNPQEWHKAEIVLTGPSRAGKTPLSMYLSVQGWKVANVPLVPPVPPPQALFQVDPRRVVGLIIDPGQLMAHRQKRQSRLGVSLGTTYTALDDIYDEMDTIRRIYRQGKFATLDVTDKPIEESAEEVIALVTRPRPA